MDNQSKNSIESFRFFPVLLYVPLSNTQRFLLSMVLSFRKKGLAISNQSLGEILNLSPWTISRGLSFLQRQELIRIENAQSRWRRIFPSNGKKYFAGISGKVENKYFAVLQRLLCPPGGNILCPPDPQTEQYKGKEEEIFSSTLADKTPSHPDPAKVNRVLQDLGFEGGGL